MARGSLALLLPAAGLLLALAHHPVQAASFDCSKATQPLDQHICKNSELSHLDDQLAASYGKAKAGLSPAGQALLQDSQRDWLAFSRRICKSRLDAKTAKAADQTADDCLRLEYQERLDDLENGITRIQGFTIQSVDLFALAPDKIDPDLPAGSRAGFSYRRISFPRIDQAPAGIDPTAWNRTIAIAAQRLAASGDGDDGAAMAKAAEAAPGNIVKPNIDHLEAADIDAAFDLGLVTPEMISVNLSYGAYGHGAAHPSGVVQTHSVLLATGAKLAARDFFKDGADWQSFMVKRSHDVWLQVMADAPDQVDDKAIADIVKDPRYWQLTERGVTVFFPFYSVGPYAVGEQQVDFSWAELKPYLVDKLPFTLPAAN